MYITLHTILNDVLFKREAEWTFTISINVNERTKKLENNDWILIPTFFIYSNKDKEYTYIMKTYFVFTIPFREVYTRVYKHALPTCTSMPSAQSLSWTLNTPNISLDQWTFTHPRHILPTHRSKIQTLCGSTVGHGHWTNANCVEYLLNK